MDCVYIWSGEDQVHWQSSVEGELTSRWKKQIFTDAEILAQSGLNTAAQSGETTPKPSSPSPRGSVKGKEKAVPDEDEGAEVNVPLVQVTPDEHGNTQDVVTAGDALDQPVANDIARDEEGVEAAAEPIEQQSEDIPSAADSGVKGKGVKEAETTAQNVLATDNEATGGYVVEPESYADAVKMSPTTEEVAAPVTPAAPTSALVPEQLVQTPSSQTAETIPTPSRPPSTSRLSFPPMPRTSSHHSGLSNTSEHDGPSTPGSITEEGGDKRRKRLSSLKGFVRRISDQGVTRSNSFKNFMSGDSPRSSPVQLDETAPLVVPTVEQPGASLPSTAAQPASTSTGGQNGQGKKKNKKKGRK